MMWRFLSHAVRLRMILLCVNAKRGLQKIDIDVLERLVTYRRPVQIVLTATDRLSDN